MKTTQTPLCAAAAVCIALMSSGCASDESNDRGRDSDRGQTFVKQVSGVSPQPAEAEPKREGSKRGFQREVWRKAVKRMENPPRVVELEEGGDEARRHVDLSALKDSKAASYEFVVDAGLEGSLSPMLLGDDRWGLKFDQASLLETRTNRFGFSHFGERDYFFELENGASLRSPYGQVSHLVFSVGEEWTRVFVDGELAGSFDGPGHVYSAAAADLGFSSRFPDSSTKFGGTIQAFAAYDRELGGDEVRNLARAALGSHVTLLGPADGDALAAGSSIEFLAAAGRDQDEEVAVEFQVNGETIGEATSAPFRFRWDKVPVGEHRVRAVVRVNGETVAESAVIAVTGGEPRRTLVSRGRRNTGKALTGAEAGAFVLRGSNNLREWDTLVVLRGIESMESLAKTVNGASKKYKFYQLFPDE